MTPSTEHKPDRAARATSARTRVSVHDSRALSENWQAARCAPDLHSAPDLHERPDALDALEWLPARVPGTAAAVLFDAGSWRLGQEHDFDAEDWWFRTSFDAQPPAPGERVYLCLDGVATVSEVYLGDALVLDSSSMFAAHELDVSEHLREHNRLTIRCRALGPLLDERRKPRARWRTRLVANGNLRFFRTMLLGRCPGIAPGPATVGPWRPVRLEIRRHVELEQLTLLPHVSGAEGVLSVLGRLRLLDGTRLDSARVELSGPSGNHSATLELRDAPNNMPDSARDAPDDRPGAARGAPVAVTVSGELRVPNVGRWWPHTHGQPSLYDVRLRLDSGSDASGQSIALDAGRVGFRELSFATAEGFASALTHDVERDGLQLHVNDVHVFVRGAVWTPIDPVALAPSEAQLRAEIERARDAGMNMLRLPGTGAYETRVFHDLCDELGVLVWQDLMFANLDYPLADESFRAAIEREADEVLASLVGRPSVVVMCGNSEVEQQAVMMGQDIALARGELFGELLPERVRASGVDCLYVPSAPCGGDVPFRTDRGVGTYYGVGCYRLPLEDVRRADVRFAAECLAHSHVPVEETVAEMAPEMPERLVGHHPAWKAGIPRENGADWDFEDVRDHYLKLLFKLDAAELRRVDHTRYLELSRALTGELLAEAFGEWRRAESRCGGALVLWLRDLLPGAGWGVIDHLGLPKPACRRLARVLTPIAVWTVDEQLNGVVAHVANDRPEPLDARLRVALYREREHLVEQSSTQLELAGHSQSSWSVEQLLGRFLDVGWSYRFGPPSHDAIVVSLERDTPDGTELISQAMRFPAGWPLERDSPARLGLAARTRALPDGRALLTLSTTRLAYGVSIHAPGHEPSDDGFSIEPGGEHTVMLRPLDAESSLQDARLAAVNMSGRVKIALE
jgi:beta-mannosidase